MVHKTYNNFKKNNLDKFLNALEQEWNNQDLKFPLQVRTLDKWIVIIMEEFGELAKEIVEIRNNHYNFSKIYKEMIQVITLLVRIRYSIYQINNHRIFI